MEVTVMAGSPAAGQAIGHVAWPAGTIPVSLLRHRRLEEPDPVIVLAPGDRLSLLAPVGPAAPLSS
jgi:Trk K+ transport system NAD-binding subunit